MIDALLLIFAADSAASAMAVPIRKEPEPSRMSQAEIRAHNAYLPRTDPNNVECRRWVPTGSWIAKSYLCRTNKEWRRVQDAGNQEARDIFEMSMHQTAG